MGNFFYLLAKSKVLMENYLIFLETFTQKRRSIKDKSYEENNRL